MQLLHYENVDTQSINAKFSEDLKHRLSLTIPFQGREGLDTLCVIGQNPSNADAGYADKTVRYLEEYIWKRQNKYGALAIVNLYSCIDTSKLESGNLLTDEANFEFNRVVSSCSDVLALFGKLSNREPYNTLRRVKEIRESLSYKRVLKFAIESRYAPHPGNPKIIYSNFDIDLDAYEFGDLSA